MFFFPVLPASLTPYSGFTIVLVCTTVRIGSIFDFEVEAILNMSLPSRKNSLFSAKNKLFLRLISVCTASDSIWLKSGFIVASSTKSEVIPYLIVKWVSTLLMSLLSAPSLYESFLLYVKAGKISNKVYFFMPHIQSDLAV